MKVREIMRNDVEIIDWDKTVFEAAERMKALNIGSIPVRKEDRLEGMITDRDIVVKGVAAGRDLGTVKVSECMTSPIVYVFDDQEAEDAAHVMEENQVRRLPILNRNKRLVGILTLTDLGRNGANESLAAQVLKKVTGPHDISTSTGAH
jgi:CBS domain-containing protein